MGGRVGRPQYFKWRGPTVEWAHPIFNTSESARGVCKSCLGCLCRSSSVFHVVFIVVAGRDAGIQQSQHGVCHVIRGACLRGEGE